MKKKKGGEEPVMKSLRRFGLLAIGVCMLAVFLLCGAAAQEDERLQVRIPVIASGANCVAVLYDSLGNTLQVLPLEKDAGNAFVVDCNGLLLTQYTAMVYSEDTEEIQYDKTMYTVYISVYYGDDEKLQAAVVIERQAGADGIPGGKEPMVRFANSPLNATLPPTATPAPVTPTPRPPYTEKFTFTKVWSGDREESIDWVMYNGDGTVRSKLFNKKIVSEYEWQYEAYFQHNVDDCYIVEYVPDGYMVRYENVGEYAHVTDRCHNGGTIINSKVPQTGDTLPLGGYVASIILSIMGLVLVVRSGRKRRTQ